MRKDTSKVDSVLAEFLAATIQSIIKSEIQLVKDELGALVEKKVAILRTDLRAVEDRLTRRMNSHHKVNVLHYLESRAAIGDVQAKHAKLRKHLKRTSSQL